MSRNGHNGSFRATLILILASTLITLLIARVGFRLVANMLVVDYRPEAGEFVRSEETGRWPGSNIFRTGNRKGSIDNFPIVHDERGFTFGRVPESLQSACLSGFTDRQQQMLQTSYINLESLLPEQGEHSNVQLTVGDSNIRVNFEHLRQRLMPAGVLLSAALGVPNTGLDRYYYTVVRWLEPGGEIDVLLAANPDIDLEVDVFVTPHNDLEDLRNSPDPENSRLVFAQDMYGKADDNKPAETMVPQSKRDRMKFITQLLGMNAAEITVMRSVIARILPQSMFADKQSFKPSLKKPAMRRALGYIDLIEQTLERYAVSGRQVRMNIIVLPSVYDLPGLMHEYTWDELMDGYVAGEHLPAGTDRLVRVRNLHFRDLFQGWYPLDADYASLFDQGDLHYTLKGMSDLTIALAIRKELFPDAWLDEGGKLTAEKRLWLQEQLLQQHEAVMQAMRMTEGVQ